MSGSVNKVILIGNLGGDPEVNSSQGGSAWGKFSLACNDKYKDRDGVWQERTEWVNIKVFGKTAENCGRYLRRGSKAYVEGRLQTHSYEKDGEKKFFTEVVANQVVFLDSKQDGQGGGDRRYDDGRGGQQGGGGYGPPQGGSGYGGNAPNQGQPIPPPPAQGSLGPDPDDQIPF
jgi:single-strand DNA-binding protein